MVHLQPPRGEASGMFIYACYDRVTLICLSPRRPCCTRSRAATPGGAGAARAMCLFCRLAPSFIPARGHAHVHLQHIEESQASLMRPL